MEVKACLLLLFAFVAGFVRSQTTDVDYGLMMDAGSSGTRMHIYEWPHRENTSLPLVEAAQNNVTQKALTKNTTPGLSTFADNLDGIAAYLQPLIDYAKTWVPESRWNDTPIYLKATAGLRMLPQSDQDAIMQTTRTFLAASGFLFSNDTWCQVIPGSQEGLFSWISVNYNYNKLGLAASETYGIVEMGGASMQLTFSPLTAVTDPSAQTSVTLDNVKYNLYSYSWLYYGGDQATIRYNEYLTSNVPLGVDFVYAGCQNLGLNVTYTNSVSLRNFTLVGNSDWQQCISDTYLLLNVSGVCSAPPCGVDGAYQSPLTGVFHGLSTYFYQADFLFNSTQISAGSISVADIKNATAAYCAKDWTEVNTEYAGQGFLDTYCFKGMYIWNVLGYGYGFDTIATQTIFYDTADWTVGAMIYEANLLPLEIDDGGDSSSSGSVPISVNVWLVVVALLLSATVFQL